MEEPQCVHTRCTQAFKIHHQQVIGNMLYENKDELKSMCWSGGCSGGTLVRPDGGSVVHISMF